MKIKYQLWALVLVFAALCSSCDESSMKSSDFFDSKPQLALADAAAHGDIVKIDELITAGIDVNATGRGGMTALFWALLQQNKKGFAHLLERGANPNIQLTETLGGSDSIVTAGNSAISFAAMHKDVEYLKTALLHGGNSNLINPLRTNTPIYESILALRVENAKALIAAGANLNYQDRDGETPMFVAATTSCYDLVFEMLEAGADPTIKNTWGYTILYPIRNIRTDPQSQQYKWRQKVIDRLKEKGMDVENGK